MYGLYLSVISLLMHEKMLRVGIVVNRVKKGHMFKIEKYLFFWCYFTLKFKIEKKTNKLLHFPRFALRKTVGPAVSASKKTWFFMSSQNNWCYLSFSSKFSAELEYSYEKGLNWCFSKCYTAKYRFYSKPQNSWHKKG